MRFTVIPLFIGAVWAQTNAELAIDTLQQWYNQTSGIWDTCGWWNGANCMTVLADLAKIDGSVAPTATSVFAHTYTQAPGVNPAPQLFKVNYQGRYDTHYPPGWPNVRHPRPKPQTADPNAWLDGYYDDAGWWALAWIAAYDLTGTADYLSLAEGIFDNMAGSWPTNCSNGGIYWNTQHSYINAIANELFLSVAAHLANRADNGSYYADWATKEWNWFQQTGMINGQNVINDGLTTDCQNNGQTVWSYNQGVVLGGLVELNKYAANSTLIDQANTIAQAAIANLSDSNMVIHDTCEPNCAPDATQFKGIFIRNLQELQSVSPNDQYKNVINACANSIWANDRLTSNNSLSIDWAGPFVSWVNASTHSSATDALVAAQAIS